MKISASGILLLIGYTPIGDKITQMIAKSSRIEAGQVYLPARTRWLDDFRTELLQFPNGKHDDQVDSLSQFLDWIERPFGNRVWVQTWVFDAMASTSSSRSSSTDRGPLFPKRGMIIDDHKG